MIFTIGATKHLANDKEIKLLNYLQEEYNLSDPELVSVFDELPLWSSYFGEVLLDKINIHPGINILDIGCGTGFPLLEIAQRFGGSCNVYGIDPWSKAVERVKKKIKFMKLENVKVIEGKAEELPFDDNYFQLIVSNNGINNVDDQHKVFSECFRTASPGAQFVYTVNLPGTMIEFYNLFEEVLAENNLINEIEFMKHHILSKRKTPEMNIDMIISSGFKVFDIVENKFLIRFIDGTAMLNHYFIKLAFVDSWKKIVPKEKLIDIFFAVEDKLNQYASRNGELKLTIPFACFNCIK